MEDFYHRLSYSFGNEDWETEKKALQIKKGDRVVCVTASGDRPLNLLTEECSEIVAVDTNPMQSALLDLKRAAISELNYDDYLQFLGMKPSDDRLSTYKKLSANLDESSDRIWNKHSKSIKRGVLFEGAMEKRIKLATFLINMTRKRKIKRLFSFKDINEQKEFAQKHFDGKLWRGFIDLFLQPRFTKLFLKDPGLYEYVDSTIDVGHYIHDRLHDALARFPAKESPLLSIVLRGRVDIDHLPPYLQREGVKKIKPHLDRLRIQTDDLISFLEKAPDNSFDCFSLSDVASYIPFDKFERMIQAVYRCARPGARFSIRQFLTKYKIPKKMAPFFERDEELEQKLSDEDRCFVYTFTTGTIKKSVKSDQRATKKASALAAGAVCK